DWRVSLYTWTKGLAAGIYMTAIGFPMLGTTPWENVWVRLVAPLLSLFFLALTGALLIADLEHPRRFLYIFMRPQWKSWLVRGAFTIGAYAAVLAVHVAAGLVGRPDIARLLALVLGLPLAAMTAAYTGWLFAQAKGRDLWQNPLAPLHMVVQ